MALVIKPQPLATPMWIPQSRLFLTEDKSRVVGENSPEARFLFAVPGRPILRSEALKYGLVRDDPVVEVKEAQISETKEVVIEETKDAMADDRGSSGAHRARSGRRRDSKAD